MKPHPAHYHPSFPSDLTLLEVENKDFWLGLRLLIWASGILAGGLGRGTRMKETRSSALLKAMQLCQLISLHIGVNHLPYLLGASAFEKSHVSLYTERLALQLEFVCLWT